MGGGMGLRGAGAPLASEPAGVQGCCEKPAAAAGGPARKEERVARALGRGRAPPAAAP
jgi:hypothetical protein